MLAILLNCTMSEANQLIKNLERGVELLIEKVTSLTEVVNNKDQKIEELKRLNQVYKTENDSLNEKITRLNTQVQESNSDSEKIGQYKTRINELVNEIDSCISLLNG